jgi:hypothetical protein
MTQRHESYVRKVKIVPRDDASVRPPNPMIAGQISVGVQSKS